MRGLPGFQGHFFQHVEETTSTNDVLKQDWSQEAIPERVLAADHQTAGRGQAGRSWWDRPGDSLLFSFSWPSYTFSERNLPPSLVVGLALHNALSVLLSEESAVSNSLSSPFSSASSSPDSPFRPENLWLKWPNDVYLEKAKVAGILVESQISSQGNGRLVVGIGVNVRGARPELPTGEPAASLEQALGSGLVPQQILSGILAAWSEIQTGDYSSDRLLRCWEKAAAPLWGSNVKITDPAGETRTVQALGIASGGGLRVLLPDGTQKILYSVDRLRLMDSNYP
ncbi:MAG: biotin--[acetyl-CoA-carboxylase] ligase [Candidatus Ozemobacteraceae bacterium]